MLHKKWCVSHKIYLLTNYTFGKPVTKKRIVEVYYLVHSLQKERSGPQTQLPKQNWKRYISTNTAKILKNVYVWNQRELKINLRQKNSKTKKMKTQKQLFGLN